MWWLLLFVSYLATNIWADRKFGSWAIDLLGLGWFLCWLVHDTFFGGDMTNRVVDAIFVLMYAWFLSRNFPKDKFKKLKKAVGAKIKAIIDAMSDFVKGAKPQTA